MHVVVHGARRRVVAQRDLRRHRRRRPLPSHCRRARRRAATTAQRAWVSSRSVRLFGNRIERRPPRGALARRLGRRRGRRAACGTSRGGPPAARGAPRRARAARPSSSRPAIRSFTWFGRTRGSSRTSCSATASSNGRSAAGGKRSTPSRPRSTGGPRKAHEDRLREMRVPHHQLALGQRGELDLGRGRQHLVPRGRQLVGVHAAEHAACRRSPPPGGAPASGTAARRTARARGSGRARRCRAASSARTCRVRRPGAYLFSSSTNTTTASTPRSRRSRCSRSFDTTRAKTRSWPSGSTLATSITYTVRSSKLPHGRSLDGPSSVTSPSQRVEMLASRLRTLRIVAMWCVRQMSPRPAFSRPSKMLRNSRSRSANVSTRCVPAEPIVEIAPHHALGQEVDERVGLGVDVVPVQQHLGELQHFGRAPTRAARRCAPARRWSAAC